MAEETTTNQDTVEDPNLLGEAGAKDTLLGEASDEEKQAQADEEKRLLETKDEDLSEEDKPKKAELVKAKEAEQVPEKYEFKVPEGMTLDQGLADKVSPVFKEMKISQADAQKLTDIYSEHVKAIGDAQNTDFKQFLKDSYDETIKALGSNYKEQLKYVAKVRDRFFSEETQELMEVSGLGNQKPVILDLINLGKLISEDKLARGERETPAGSKSAAELMYPNQGK